MDNEILADLIAQQLGRANDWDSNNWQPNRDAALGYYYGRARGDETEGRSKVISQDVSEMVEACIAQIAPAFSGQMPVQFEAEAQEDEAQAQSESHFVHRSLSAGGQGFKAISQGLKDALLLRNCIVHVWMDEREETETTVYEDVPPGMVAMLVQPRDESETVEHVEVERETGAEDETVERGVDLTVRRHKEIRTLQVAAVAPENFRLWPGWTTTDLTMCPFIAERKRYPRGQLIGLGVESDIAESLSAAQPQGDTTTLVRQPEQSGGGAAVNDDPALDEVEFWDVQIRCDYNGDGEAVLIRAWFHSSDTEGATQGQLIKDPEEIPFHGYRAGVVMLEPHRFLGQSLYDKLRNIQDGKTSVLRQWLDNLRYLNDRRIGVVKGQADPNLVMKPIPGQAIEIATPNSLVPIPVDDAGPTALSALAYLDRARSELGGGSLDMQSGQAQVQGALVGGAGVDRQFSARESLANWFLRVFGETLLREVYLVAHATLREWSPGTMRAKLNGNWTEADPITWKPRRLASVNLAGASGQRNALATAYQQTIQMQTAAMQVGKGGELVDDINVFNAILAWSRVTGIENPESYWQDPRSREAQMARQQKAQAAQAQSSAQLQMTAMVAKIGAIIEKYKTDQDNAIKVFQEIIRAEVEEMKLMGEATTQLQVLELSGAARSQELAATPMAVPGPGNGQGGPQ